VYVCTFVVHFKLKEFLPNNNCNIAQNALQSTYIFENQLCPTMAVQQRQHVDVIGCGMIFSGLIGMFVFHILQISSGCIALPCILLATGLSRPLMFALVEFLRKWGEMKHAVPIRSNGIEGE
jgi:hypothetical protein